MGTLSILVNGLKVKFAFPSKIPPLEYAIWEGPNPGLIEPVTEPVTEVPCT